MARFGPDVSNHQGEISPATAQCMAQHGQTCAVVRLSLEDTGKQAIARRQMQAFQGAGLAVMGYVWAYFTEDPVSTAQQALDWYGDLDPVRWWLDCEETDPRWRGESHWQRTDWLNRCLDTLEALGMAAGIYTANWWWAPYMAGTAAFNHHPLWVAEYDNDADLDRFYPFGGWDHCAGKQFTGTGSLCGVQPLDLNLFNDGLFSVEAPVPEPSDADKLSYLSALTHDILPAVITELEATRGKTQADQAHIDRALTALREHAG